MKRDDSLWKGILEDIFDDFLLFFFADDNEIFDIKRGFEFLDKELEQLFPTNQDEFYPRYVDKLVKVFTIQGTEEWILIHIEVQGATDRNFGERMFSYFYRILDKYHKPIAAFAILTDRNRNFCPKFYERSFLGTRLRYDFNTYKVMEQAESELKASNNPFSMVVLTVKTALKKRKLQEEELFELKVELAKELLKKQFPKEKIRALMNFLKLYIRFEKEEMVGKFDQQIDIITQNTKTMGIEEFILHRERELGMRKGIEKGIEKGYNEKNYAIVKSLLQETDFDTAKIARLGYYCLRRKG